MHTPRTTNWLPRHDHHTITDTLPLLVYARIMHTLAPADDRQAEEKQRAAAERREWRRAQQAALKEEEERRAAEVRLPSFPWVLASVFLFYSYNRVGIVSGIV